jgi:hypothetical protein
MLGAMLARSLSSRPFSIAASSSESGEFGMW